MQYTVGQELVWIPAAKWDKPAPVTVTGLRKGGCAVLSNGWQVDDDGIAAGTGRVLGGRVIERASLGFGGEARRGRSGSGRAMLGAKLGAEVDLP